MKVAWHRSRRWLVAALVLAVFGLVPSPLPAQAHHQPFTGISVTSDGSGYVLVSEAGEVYAYGTARYLGNAVGFSGKIVDISITADGRGYAMISSTGQVYAFGTVVYRGNPTGFTGSIVDISVTADGLGYVAISSTGQVYAYNVVYRGNPTGYSGSIVGVSVRPDGQGYAAISSAGQVYAYNVVYRGNPTGFTGSIVDIAVTNGGQGYVAISSVGQVYAYNVVYRGNPGGSIAGVSVTADGRGYAAVATNGQAHAYGTVIWQHQNANVYVNWSIVTLGDMWNVDQNIQVLKRAPATFWTSVWKWSNDPAHGGYLGLQTDGARLDGSTGDTAIFSIWNATAARGPSCGSFGGEGVGLSCRAAYGVSTNRLYRLRLWRLESTVSGQWWGAWIRDQATGIETWIGDLRAPVGSRSVALYQNFSEYFGRQMLLASMVPQSIADYTQPAANYTGSGGVYGAVGNYAGHTQGDGTTAKVELVDYGWTRAARVTMGG